ncbi:hypothetical protein [Corynebacterium sp. HMSC034A01]|uniref:hypothetical protein n=1 Tax=Corynebacterium sp. HMSC034A01 TaxID=1739295 RepID=UPI000A8E7F1A|nr:hypothetical protein [Corynebacterium sp. HMSC034A01]
MAARATRSATLTRNQSRTPGRTQGHTQGRTQHSASRVRTMPGVKPHVEHPKSRGRLGSNQVVSVRGRRVATTKVRSKFSSLSQIALPLLVVGIAVAMILSGIATTQTFAIQKLQAKEQELANEVESLNRDLEDRRSSAALAQRADSMGMVLAGEPGVVAVNDEGHAEEQRPYNPESASKLVDVNGEGRPASRASSDDRATKELEDALTQRPGRAANAPRIDNLAPYQANVAAQP